MTEAFWTPEKKADYKKLLEKREKRRRKEENILPSVDL